MKDDFRCPFCNGETKEFSKEILNLKTMFDGTSDKKLTYCKKHKFLLYEREYYGGGFLKQASSRWVFIRGLEPTDFTCSNCIYWNLKKGIEDEEGIRKTCELGLQKGKEYDGMSFCDSCEKFKWGLKIC